MPNWDAAEVARRLELDASFGPWLQQLQGVGEIRPLPWIEADAVMTLVERFGLAAGDAAEIGAELSALQQDAAVWWLAERCHYNLIRHMGDADAPPFQSPHLPERAGGGLLWLAVFLAAIPDARQWHAGHGIPEDVSWATLSPLGEQIRRYKDENGRWGIAMPFFPALAFRGVLFRIGRLSYIPYRLRTGPGGPLFWYDAPAAAAMGPGFRPGDPALSIHVPAETPLEATECDASLRRAGEIFAEHFVPEAPRIATCTAWLLDPQLAEYLPAGSNIIRFQRCFQLVPGVRIDNESIVSALRGSSEAAADEPARETSLQRAVTRHREAGKDWHLRTGWLDLRGAAGAE
jgi:hypothetical protein